MSKRKQWSGVSMAAAVKGVEEGMGLREAPRLYNVPVETLRRRTTGSVAVDCRPGPSTILSEYEEERLAKYCLEMSEKGFGLGREDVMRTAFLIAEKSGRKHPFQNGKAGRAWFDGFCCRHPRLTLRKPEPLSYARAAACTSEKISEFFGKLAGTCAKLNILGKPMQIFNADETGISIVHKPGKVISELGKRVVWAVTSAEKGKTHTVMVCVSASGFVLPPMIIYPRKRISESLKEDGLPGTLYTCSDSGWINEGLFSRWFDFFLENIPPTRPVLLIYDGHASHISIELIEKSRAHNIHLLCLPSHTTHLLQPLDLSVFKPLKTNYSKACKQLLAKNPGRVITTNDIAGLVAQAWPLSLTPVNIMSGFKKSGIFPLNPGVITDRQLAPSKAVVPPVDASKESDTSTSQTSTSGTSDTSRASDTSSVNSTKTAAASSSDHLEEVLILPKPKPKKGQGRKRVGLTTHTQLISGSPFLSMLRKKKADKKEMEAQKKERAAKREQKSTAKKQRGMQRFTKKSDEKMQKITKTLEDLELSESDEFENSTESEEDNVVCQECGDNTEGMWICCDGCDGWYHLQCTELSDARNLPDLYICKDCH